MVTPLLENKRAVPVFVAVVAVLASAFVVTVLGGGTTELLYTFGAGAVVSAVVVGVYVVGSRYGHPHSHAVAEAAAVLGVLYLALLLNRLLTEFGTFSTTESVTAIGGALVAMLAFVAVIGLLGRVGAAS